MESKNVGCRKTIAVRAADRASVLFILEKDWLNDDGGDELCVSMGSERLEASACMIKRIAKRNARRRVSVVVRARRASCEIRMMDIAC